jgi:hypothetical protein
MELHALATLLSNTAAATAFLVMPATTFDPILPRHIA